jgi:nicotinate (nicotinamide) nucleotide adenylyltransferase
LKTLIELLKTTPATEIVLYPGTFNPWHQGHRACLDLAQGYGQVIVLPDLNPEKKIDRSHIEKIITNLKQTLKKNEILFLDFLELSKPNPTYSWIVEVKKELPQKKLKLLIGYDQFIKIHNWQKPELLLSHLDALLVASRLDDELNKREQEKKLKNAYPLLEIRFLGHHSFENVSSTSIRERKDHLPDN